ncbi:hypothetical protein like AT4G29090 [Hibiscus trionum]|uniref:RNase H type-1 domain-containing protein n=1 Tax=Hibiscus trionum TaxID=183268 RepID=A0A9W7HWR7_HIBTR|nr:hypothetical protein like AT4G29090 [Hibiscus trionum]
MPVGVESKINSLLSKFIWGPTSSRPIRWVKWNQLCSPKEVGGLGLFNLRVKNRALLNKWMWRFGSEKQDLWRRVIVEKYNMDECMMVPNITPSRITSWVWRNISSPVLNPNDSFVSNLRWVLGDGESIRFWSDHWTEVKSLKDAFLRIFRLASNPSGFVCEYGIKVDNQWRWTITLRRVLFEWEKSVWEEFLEVLSRASKCSNDTDQLKWCGTSTGIYRSREFCLLESTGVSPADNFWKKIWVNLAPPKVEMFVWRSILNKIPTLDNLIKRVWILSIFGFIWSIWLFRNERIFKNKPLNADSLFYSSLAKIAFWCKCKWPDSFTSTLDFISQPNLLSIQIKSNRLSCDDSWIAPPLGVLKFNMDASVEGAFGPSGLGGILRDNQGQHLLKFSKNGGPSDSTGAEIRAILEAGQIFLRSNWCGKFPLVIESDSQMAVRWITEEVDCPAPFKEVVAKCKSLCKEFHFNVESVYREKNVEAHNLATEGRKRASDVLWSVDRRLL